jgi:AraC-like DNA-binding protein
MSAAHSLYCMAIRNAPGRSMSPCDGIVTLGACRAFHRDDRFAADTVFDPVETYACGAALLSGSDGIARIAESSGYHSGAAFTRAFKREFGVPPSAGPATQRTTTKVVRYFVIWTLLRERRTSISGLVIGCAQYQMSLCRATG